MCPGERGQHLPPAGRDGRATRPRRVRVARGRPAGLRRRYLRRPRPRRPARRGRGRRARRIGRSRRLALRQRGLGAAARGAGGVRRGGSRPGARSCGKPQPRDCGDRLPLRLRPRAAPGPPPPGVKPARSGGPGSDRLEPSSAQQRTSDTRPRTRQVDRTIMSGPNTSYDPVEVAVLSHEAVDQAVDQALAAIAAAADLDALKRVRLEHAGDASPLALANREIGALPPAARKDAGQRVGKARAAVGRALEERREHLEAERDARVIVEEAVDVTLPVDRIPPGARHPLEAITERITDIFVGMGWEVAEGPELEAEWFNFDALNFDPDHPA